MRNGDVVNSNVGRKAFQLIVVVENAHFVVYNSVQKLSFLILRVLIDF